MPTSVYETKKCDVLIIGGGGSGALAGLTASKNEGLKVIVTSRGPISQSGLTPTGNGGTAVSDATEALFNDMVKGGDYLNDQNIIGHMLNEIPQALEKLQALGVMVTRFAPFAVCVPGVETLAILRKKLFQKSNVDVLEDVLITRLLKVDGRITGAVALDLATGQLFGIDASAVVIATGGIAGELYPRSSNNPLGVSTDASGTGHVMAYRAGAKLIDMEMMAFVPLPASPECQNLRYFPDFWRGPYTNRQADIVESDTDGYLGGSYSHLFVQKLSREIEKGNGPFYIDQRGFKKPESNLSIRAWDRRRRFINSLGIDPAENKIEITIGSHFCMGGIYVNERTETTISGLFAAGEVMGGVHGGLRLPGFSFTQMIVFGFEAGQQAAAYAASHKRAAGAKPHDTDRDKERIFGFLESKSDPTSLPVLKARLQQIMQNGVFVFRNVHGLQKALDEIAVLKKEAARIRVPNFKKFNLDWVRAIEFSFLIEGAEIIARSALFRQESRGFHYRTDFENRNDQKWLLHTVAECKAGRLNLDTAPVVLDRMTPED